MSKVEDFSGEVPGEAASDHGFTSFLTGYAYFAIGCGYIVGLFAFLAWLGVALTGAFSDPWAGPLLLSVFGLSMAAGTGLIWFLLRPRGVRRSLSAAGALTAAAVIPLPHLYFGSPWVTQLSQGPTAHTLQWVPLLAVAVPLALVVNRRVGAVLAVLVVVAVGSWRLVGEGRVHAEPRERTLAQVSATIEGRDEPFLVLDAPGWTVIGASSGGADAERAGFRLEYLRTDAEDAYNAYAARDVIDIGIVDGADGYPWDDSMLSDCADLRRFECSRFTWPDGGEVLVKWWVSERGDVRRVSAARTEYEPGTVVEVKAMDGLADPEVLGEIFDGLRWNTVEDRERIIHEAVDHTALMIARNRDHPLTHTP
ncbi:hypothetical protein [Nocardiopsis valliformis]|uniref:hypothetical protein n=1 Tax=Nocardiopsis valliformis TaxID=239974 RepID=UPI00034D67CC|nr:hypothetical protein [Nocardiopsis valliformis]